MSSGGRTENSAEQTLLNDSKCHGQNDGILAVRQLRTHTWRTGKRSARHVREPINGERLRVHHARDAQMKVRPDKSNRDNPTRYQKNDSI